MKKFLCFFLTLLLTFSLLAFSVSAEEVSVSDYAPKKYPSWDTFELMKKAFPESRDINGVEYSFDSHIILHDTTGTYADGTAKVLCYVWDSRGTSISAVDGQFHLANKDNSLGQSRNMVSYYWDYDLDRWVYRSIHNSVYSNFRDGGLIYSTVSIPEWSNTDGLVYYPSGKLTGLKPPSWLSLTWDDMSVAPSNMMSEIIDILPLVLVLLMSLLAIRKGISFVFAFFRNA